MQLAHALAQAANVDNGASRDDVYQMTGGLAADTDANAFRFFHDPTNPRSYLVINKDDVVGDVYPLTDLERAQNKFVNANVYRIGIAHGTRVKSISLTIETIGETISAETTATPKAAGDCINTSGCGSKKCCTYGSDGKCYCDDCCIA